MNKYNFSLDEIKENPLLQLSELPEKAEEELVVFYNYLIYKYNIPINENKAANKSINYENKMSKNEFLSFLENDFSLSNDELKRIEDTQKEINKWIVQEF